MVLFLGDSFGEESLNEGRETRRETRTERRESARPGAGISLCILFNGSMRQAKDGKNESRFQYFGKGMAEPSWGRRNLDAGRLHGGDLGVSAALAAGDDGAGMAHATARWRGASGDKADHRLLAAALGFVLQKLRGVFFRRAADLTDHDDRFGRFVGEKHFQHFDEVGALYGIAADADRSGLAEPFPRGLEHRLVSQRAGARDDADLPGLENVAGHDADLAFARGHDARAVRPDQARFRAAQRALDLDHVAHRNAFGDAHDERNLRRDRFGDGIGRTGRRHIDHAGIGAGFFARFGNGVEYREIEMRRSAFARRHAADHFRAVSDRLLGMEGAVLAGKALADDFGVLVDEDGHYRASLFCTSP